MLDTINKSWGWIGATATEIISENDFGNIIFKSEKGNYWRICPEELSCKMIAENSDELEALLKDPEFIEDWEMAEIVSVARKSLGKLTEGQKYCVKLPIILRGEYTLENFGIIKQIEQIAFTGELGHRIKDMPDGAKIDLLI